MYIATVIPIKKGVQKEYLSYFSARDIELGSIVSIPLRLKVADAIVINMEDAEQLKSNLKSREYQLKKIKEVKGASPFAKEFFTACDRMKNYVVASTGAVINALLPKTILENISILEKPNIFETENKTEVIKQEKLIFQAAASDRLGFYRTLIREAFAKKQSIFLCVPTRYDIETYTLELIKGIEQYVVAFHSDMPKKAMIESYNKVMNEPHPLLLIGTGMFLSIPRDDIQTLIIEHESSDAYKQLARPYIDVRSFGEVLSSTRNWKLILADTLLRPETLHRHEEGELGEIHPPSFRLLQAEEQLITDMKEETDERGSKKFNVLSEKTKEALASALSRGESTFLFSVRKGLAGVTVCHDCGHTLLCPSCSTPIVLYSAKKQEDAGGRIFMCNKCGHKETTETRCPTCSSWNLVPLGIGTDRVSEEVEKLFPKATRIQIDKETTPTDKEARAAMAKFIKTPGAILIGTEMVFSYLHTRVTNSAIISLDGLLSIPSFNINQKILHIIEKLHHLTDRMLIIQTRIPDNQVLKYIVSGNVLPLYREDSKERQAFGYPPFKRLIKITFTGTARETEKARSYLAHTLGAYDPQIFSAFIARIKGNYITNTVIRVDPKVWPLPTSNRMSVDTSLFGVLSNLPPSFSINVDPEDLL